MAGILKHDELEFFRLTLLSLKARLRGDLDQMTDEALRRNLVNGSGNLRTCHFTWRMWAQKIMIRNSPWN